MTRGDRTLSPVGRPDRIAIVGAVAIVAILFAGLGSRDLWNPNEPTYGLAVREMAERGDWWVPSVRGVPFTEKPPLYFWAARATGAVLGVGPWALRLPGAIAALLTVVAVYRIAREVGDRRYARVASAVAATTFATYWGARTVQMDILVTAALAWTVYFAIRALDGEPGPESSTHRPLAWVASGVCAGLGFLAKGPVAWVFAAVVIGGYAAASGRPRRVVSKETALAALAAVAVPVPWVVGMWAAGHGDFLHEALVRQNFARFVEAWDHREPWWYYLKYVWIDFLPWVVLVPFALGAARTRLEVRRVVLGFVWLLGPIAFLSLSDSKRSAYLWPAIPAIALLASTVLTALAERTLSRLRRTGAMVAMVVVATVIAALGIALFDRVPERWPTLALAAVAVAVVLVPGGALTIASVFSRRGPSLVPAVLGVTVACAYVTGAVVALPAADSIKSARPFCGAVDAAVATRTAGVTDDEPPCGGTGAGRNTRIGAYRLWAWRAAYAYYCAATFVDLEDDDALRAYWSGKGRRYVLVEGAHVDRVAEILGADATRAVDREIGDNRAVLFARTPGTGPRGN